MSEAKKHDPIGKARMLLAGIEADCRREHDKMKQMQTAGADHFQARLDQIRSRGLNEGNVDAWCREADSIAFARKK